MFNIERYKEYEIKLMPNFFEIQTPILQLNKKYNDKPYKLFVTYFLNDQGKIDIVKISSSLINYISSCKRGFYGTSEGYFLSYLDDEVKFYYANSDKSDIQFDPYIMGNDTKVNEEVAEKYKRYNDVVFYDRFMLHDVKCGYNLTFKTTDVQGFMKFYNIGLKKCESLYKEGDDKNKILSLYDGVYQLKDYDKYVLNEERKAKIKSIIPEI